MVKDEVSVLEKYRYPSLTFCYLYKHGPRLLDEVIDDVEDDAQGQKKRRNAAKNWQYEGGKNIWWVYHRQFNEKW